MIYGMSKELMKVEVNYGNYDIEKLQSIEIFGLYLIGEITTNKLLELFEIERKELGSMINRVCTDIENTTKRDESKIEVTF
jgi:hypothetical protein